jgi:hypothetical protein
MRLITFLVIISFAPKIDAQDNRIHTYLSLSLPEMKILDITKKNMGVFFQCDSIEESRNTRKVSLSIIDTTKKMTSCVPLLKIKNGKISLYETPQVPTSLLIFYEKDKQRGGLVVEEGNTIRLFNKDGYETYDRINERGRLKILHFLSYYKGTAIELPSLKINMGDITNKDTISKDFVILVISRDVNKDIHHTFIFPKDPIKSDQYYYSTNLLSTMLSKFLSEKNLHVISSLLIPGILVTKDPSLSNWVLNDKSIMSLKNDSNEINLNYYFW